MAAEGNLDVDHQICLAVYNASRAMTAAYRSELSSTGLTYSQYAVMLVLWEEENTTLRDLGTRLHLDSGTLSPLLKRLESMGYLTRARDTVDERVLNIALTDQGRSIREAAKIAQCNVERLTGLGTSELAMLRKQLNELAATLRGDDA